MSVIPRQSWLANERPDILKYNHFRRYILLQINERPDILKYNHFRRYILLQGKLRFFSSGIVRGEFRLVKGIK